MAKVKKWCDGPICSSRGTPTDTKYIYCSSCGSLLKTKAYVECRECRKEVDPDSKFCPYCGSKDSQIV